jgi:hypothetical protein
MHPGQLSIAKMNNHHQPAFHSLAGSSDAGKHPVHFQSVREPKNHLVHQALGGDRAGNRNDFRVLRHLGDKVPRIKLTQLFSSDSAG